jgi:hypothetical protein
MRVHRDVRGAVLVEFLVALMPLMTTFSCIVQVTQTAMAKLVVMHAAIVGTRAAAVISNKNNNTPDQPKGDNKKEIEAGVRVALGPWATHMESLVVKVDDQSSCDDPFGMVKVTVTAKHRCSIPLGGRLVCGAVGASLPLEQTYAMPHQGARYAEGGGTACDKSDQ